MNKKIIILVGLVFLAVALVMFFSAPQKKAGAQLISFAQCLAGKNVTMYGAYWCAHCQNQKAAFQGAFQYVPYVECTEDSQKCLAENINGYPTWIFPDGKRLEGEQSLNNLAVQSGCVLNQINNK